MPLLTDSVFTIWNTIKKSALGISDQSQGFDGLFVSFLPTGMPVDKADYFNPAAPGANVNPDSLNRLRKVCELTDKRLQYTAENTCYLTNSLLSSTYRLIIGEASSIGLPPLTDEVLIQQLKDAYACLYTDGDDFSTKTPRYRNYLAAIKEWQKALIAYASGYQQMQVNPELEQSWPQVGMTLLQDITDALADISPVRDKVENAQALIGAQTKDTAAAFIAAAKVNVDPNQGRFSMAVGGGLSVLFTEILPSAWCDPDAENWTQFEFDSATSHFAEHSETTSWGGGGGLSFGFWSIGGNSQHTESRTDLNIENDSLYVSFEYSIAEINRPWLDTLLFRLKNWFIPGQEAGTVSKGTGNTISASLADADSLWLPAIPSQLILVKNLFISNSKFQEAYEASHSSLSSGGSFGWGPFSISGHYSREEDNVTKDTYEGHNGLRVKGVQIIGWVNEVIPLSPKIAQPGS